MKNTCLLILVFFSCVSCSSQDQDQSKERYGLSFNNTRNNLKVPIIEKGWVNHERNDSLSFWANTSRTLQHSKPHHFYKIGEINNDSSYIEIDAYHFKYDKSDIRSYRMKIYSYFSGSKLDSQTFELIAYLKEGFPPTETIKLSRSEADSLFIAWGLNVPLSDLSE